MLTAPEQSASSQTSIASDRIHRSRAVLCLVAAFLMIDLAGCGGSGSAEVGNAESQNAEPIAETVSVGAIRQPDSSPQPLPSNPEPLPSNPEPQGDEETEYAPLAIGALAGRNAQEKSGAAGDEADSEKNIQSVIEKLRPLQVMLGKWRGTTRKEFEGFKAVDEHEWVWDLTTQPSQPALIMKSDKSPYLRSARLTWLPSDQTFRMEVIDPEGKSRMFMGNYTEEVHEVVGSDDKLHKVFRLELNEELVDGESAAGRELTQLAFAQQESNRYLLEVSQRRGKAAWRRVDTVSTQREGTSFALSDTDYAEKTCIISQGLGTMSISYKGRDYWVCCSGCRAAFEEDPERWIARSAEMQKKQ